LLFNLEKELNNLLKLILKKNLSTIIPDYHGLIVKDFPSIIDLIINLN